MEDHYFFISFSATWLIKNLNLVSCLDCLLFVVIDMFYKTNFSNSHDCSFSFPTFISLLLISVHMTNLTNKTASKYLHVSKMLHIKIELNFAIIWIQSEGFNFINCWFSDQPTLGLSVSCGHHKHNRKE